MAIVNVLLNVAFMIPATWLVLQDRVFNPAFIAELGFPDGLGAAVLAPVMAQGQISGATAGVSIAF